MSFLHYAARLRNFAGRCGWRLRYTGMNMAKCPRRRRPESRGSIGLVFSQTDPLKLSRRVATRFFMECEERIDVVVMNPRRLTAEQRAFLATLNTEHIE